MACLLNSLVNFVPIVESGSDVHLTIRTENGDLKKVLDGSSGAAVASLGHNHPKVMNAIQRSAGTPYVYNGLIRGQACDDLAKFIIEHSPENSFSHVQFFTSGSDSIETAMKLARQYHYERGQLARINFISRKKSYHGNTLGALSLSDNKARSYPYEDMLRSIKNFSKVSPYYPYRDQLDSETVDEYVKRLLDEMDNEFQRVGTSTVCAVVLEPVSGTSLGAIEPALGYLSGIRDICNKYGALLIFDEILCGLGRTGNYHSWEGHFPSGTGGPDLQAFGKTLCGGYLPITGVLINHRVVEAIDQGGKWVVGHQTFQDHILSATVALEVQKITFEDAVLDNVKMVGAYLGEQLDQILSSKKIVGNIRGKGLMWGIELVQNRKTKEPFNFNEKVGAQIAELARERGLILISMSGIVDGQSGDHLFLSPPYILKRENVDFLVNVISECVDIVESKLL
ncbi:PLP-dependent transferase [Nadsonia fulvescens var. elongata DSM 6958]|uniref:PLP-dependent transferase n=1 Tax=Nadsonia fulvescens var. elongata DSM 6958 TaxID=857566 RepID=A0A1E3PME5_9ASCO|nr:PLP-dependent transferase [Nadsonia fulvescens var. elongata DSM 6958]